MEPCRRSPRAFYLQPDSPEQERPRSCRYRDLRRQNGAIQGKRPGEKLQRNAGAFAQSHRCAHRNTRTQLGKSGDNKHTPHAGADSNRKPRNEYPQLHSRHKAQQRLRRLQHPRHHRSPCNAGATGDHNSFGATEAHNAVEA